MPDQAEAAQVRAPYRVTVIVPALGISKDLERCLAALAKQQYRLLEVLVVDSRPSEDCARLTARFGARYLKDQNWTRADACNHALRNIHSDVVLFTDDDCYPPKDWVDKLVRNFERDDVDGVGGPHIAPPDQGLFGKSVDVAFASPTLGVGLRYGRVFRTPRLVRHNPGCNAAYRKAALDAVGGFPTAPFGAEDVALDDRITSAGFRLWFDPEAITFHRRRETLSTLSRQMWAYGRGRADTNARCPRVASIVHVLPSVLLVGFIAILVVALATAAGWAVLSLKGAEITRAAQTWAAICLTTPVLAMLAAYVVGIASAVTSDSPYRSLRTVLVAPLVMVLAIVQYGRGFMHWHRVIKPQWRLGKL